MIQTPAVVAETEGFLVVHKPPCLHSAPLEDGDGPSFRGDTLLDWCAARYPEVRVPQGRQRREGGLLHRLDYGTWGLVLIARTQVALDGLLAQQEQGILVKEYGALSGIAPRPPLPGFPPRDSSGLPDLPFTIESGFRPYGPGRRAVRPVLINELAKKPRRECALDRGIPYRTDVLEMKATDENRCFRVKIVRGFRHQIRCHLSWLGYPVLGDNLYGGLPEPGVPQAGTNAVDTPGENVPLALKAQGLFFRDPLSGEDRQYRLPPIREFNPWTFYR
ncbi:RNA pseudouridine synthase [Spirochaetia bacterium]|nr:RNA pseudouridine synthase [Spirochaetia bacterium]